MIRRIAVTLAGLAVALGYLVGMALWAQSESRDCHPLDPSYRCLRSDR